ncbi:MAG: RNA methyltransferase [Clostridia bacterium]|nr:RNA methyltransferase [Clostridia bacterium]
MITITSAGNGIIKHIKKLSGHAYRASCQEVLLEGERLVCDSAAYGAELLTVLIREGYTGRVPEAAHCYKVSPALFDVLAETGTPQGILATAKAKQVSLEEIPKGGAIMVCDRIQDPGNVGTILRLCHGAGVDGVVLLRGTADPFNTKAVRASMGSLFAVPIAFADALPRYEGYTSFCGALTPTAASLYATKFPKKTMLIIGNEGEGVSRAILEKTHHVMIPMPGGAESFNAAVAGAVILYEYFRQVNDVR